MFVLDLYDNFCNVGLQLGKAASTSVMGTSQILFGFILQALFTHDPINYLSYIGGTLVLIGIVLMILLRSSSESPETPTREGSREKSVEFSSSSTDMVTNPLPYFSENLN